MEAPLDLWLNGDANAGIGDYIFAYNYAADMSQEYDCPASIVVHPKNPLSQTLLALNSHIPVISSHYCPDGYVDFFNSPLLEDWFSRPRIRTSFLLMQRLYHQAEEYWGHGRPRICLLWHGRADGKRWDAGFREIYRVYSSAGCNVLGLDQLNVSMDYGRAVRGDQDIGLILAIAASADLCVGFECGPWHAAVANLVPSVGMFIFRKPESLYFPVLDPPVRTLYTPRVDRLDVKTVIEACDELLGGFPLS
jgi:ADP-heptose:LPS heptosyltransferase